MYKKSRLSDTPPPDAHLECLHRIIEEVPSGVSQFPVWIGAAMFNLIILHQSRPDYDFYDNFIELLLTYNAATLKEILNITKSPELLDFINNNITSSLTKTLDEVWANLGISEKLKNLTDLEENSPKEDAWRFETGVANINPVIIEGLLKQRDELKQQISLKRQESERIKKHLEDTLKQETGVLKFQL